MRFPIFTTPPERCVAHPAGWGPITLSDGDWEVCRLPFLDSTAGAFARPTYRDSLIVAKSEDAELITVETAVRVHTTGFRCAKAAVIREIQEEKTERTKRGGRDELERMATIEWARRADLEFGEMLARWDQVALVAHPLKDWIAGGATGRSLNFGFFDQHAPDGIAYQELGTRHDWMHSDYSQVLRLRRRPR